MIQKGIWKVCQSARSQSVSEHHILQGQFAAWRSPECSPSQSCEADEQDAVEVERHRSGWNDPHQSSEHPCEVPNRQQIWPLVAKGLEYLQMERPFFSYTDTDNWESAPAYFPGLGLEQLIDQEYAVPPKGESGLILVERLNFCCLLDVDHFLGIVQLETSWEIMKLKDPALKGQWNCPKMSKPPAQRASRTPPQPEWLACIVRMFHIFREKDFPDSSTRLEIQHTSKSHAFTSWMHMAV